MRDRVLHLNLTHLHANLGLHSQKCGKDLLYSRGIDGLHSLVNLQVWTTGCQDHLRRKKKHPKGSCKHLEFDYMRTALRLEQPLKQMGQQTFGH